MPHPLIVNTSDFLKCTITRNVMFNKAQRSARNDIMFVLVVQEEDNILSIILTCVGSYVHFRMREDDIIEHTNSKCHVIMVNLLTIV